MDNLLDNEMSAKASLTAALEEIGVLVPETASLMQIRQLYQRTLAERIHAERNEPVNQPEESSTNQPDVAILEQPLPIPVNLANPIEPVILDEPVEPVHYPSAVEANVPIIPIFPSRVPSENLQHNLNDEQNLDVQIVQLEKMRRIQQLRAEIAANNIPIENPRRVEFSDIQHTIVPFTGDDSYRIRKWIQDF